MSSVSEGEILLDRVGTAKALKQAEENKANKREEAETEVMARILLGLFILKILSLASSYESEIGELMFSCPDGWTIHFGNCYMFVNMHAQHRVADNVCKRYGSKLANPKDDNELDYLKQKAKFRFINETKFWIGYSNDSHGYRDNFQPNWSEGKCVAMTIDDGLYLVDKCFKPYSFVCQKEAYSGVNCPAGYYNATATSCLPCEKGKYKNSVGNSECTSCPNSVYTTTATGSTSANNCTEVNCPAGYKYNSSSETCIVCPKGTYQTKRGNYPCVSCPGILTTFRKASTSENDCLILNCPAGYYNATATSCLPCEKGKYKNSVGNSECTSCPNSVYTTTATGSTSANNCTEVNCPAGYKYNSSSETCIVCPKGTYQTKRGNYPCVSCPGILTTFRKASTSENDCLILNCPAGYYNATATSCLPCEKGKYKNSVGNSECTSCPNSVYTTTATGSTSANNCTEVNCPAGYKYNSSSETCVVCPKGTYQTKRGNYPCVSCPGILTTFRKASTSENDCLILNCPAGYYNATATSCLPCEKGKYKNSVGNSECTSCPNSVYTTTATGSTSANNCTEVNCPAGYKYNSSSETCIVCPKGTYQTKRGNYPCVSCPGILTTFRKASTSENDCLIPPDPNVLSTAEMSISLQYTFVNCEMNQAFYEKQIKEMMAERIKELSKNYNLCSGSCELTVSINCPVSKRKKRATTRGDAKIQVGNIKADTDSTFTNEIRKTENLFREDCKLNSGQYKLESSAMLGCVVETTCTYSKLVSKECVKCPAGTKATVTGCVDCPNGTYSALDQRTCINCTYPLTSKPRSNSSSQCLAECLVNPDYCKHGGICSRGVHDLYHSCYCPIKYSGNQCEIYYEPHDPKQKWIYVGIGCIAAILVLILIVVITVIHLRKKGEEEKKHDSKLDEEPFTDPFYGLPVQGYRKNKSFVSPWKDVGKF